MFSIGKNVDLWSWKWNGVKVSFKCWSLLTLQALGMLLVLYCIVMNCVGLVGLIRGPSSSPLSIVFFFLVDWNILLENEMRR